MRKIHNEWGCAIITNAFIRNYDTQPHIHYSCTHTLQLPQAAFAQTRYPSNRFHLPQINKKT